MQPPIRVVIFGVPGDLVQAQRDCVGGHTYERLDAPGAPVHSDWEPRP